MHTDFGDRHSRFPGLVFVDSADGVEMSFETLRWSEPPDRDGPALILLDQTRLPMEVIEVACRDVETVAVAIEELKVRGAPAIGVAAAYGVALGAWRALETGAKPASFRQVVGDAVERLARTRPTAVNLFWALDLMKRLIDANSDTSNQELYELLRDAAHRLCEEDVVTCKRIGQHGADLLKDGSRVLTHCNAGSLATAGYGTALGVIYAATETGKRIEVFADETRPLLQGSRLTAWELMQHGVPVTVICDNMAASVMAAGKVDCVIVGADRIAANGDVANKIGTYRVAILAREHGIPFYVAAPTSTVDMKLASGDTIPIEERKPEEVSEGMGTRTAPREIRIYNPAFDVTPNRLVSGIITEFGVATSPFEPTLRQWTSTGLAETDRD